ncbi:MAG TPA: aminopeptidase [Burkholderiales bacterium]|nr:aminopeptidase [Burkholderiales bacterium]
MRAFLLLSAVLLGGCETLSYYGQAAGGQLALMARARPLEEVVAAPALQERLGLARAIRDFASRELALPDNGAYRSYADLGRPYALWNVVAAPEFSLAPVQSCFPIAGCVSYRGYYGKEAAERHASAQRALGHDVVVYGVPAYSTLGWFDDPLLSTFIHYPEADLARLMFHELAHQVAYVKDDSTFNESFAVVVEREGLRRWLAAQGKQPAPRFDPAPQVAAVRAQLEALYRTRLSPEAMRERKRAALETLRPLVARMPAFEGQEPNNAFVASYATYTDLVPAFDRLLAASGGDLARYYDRVRSLARLPPAERNAQLR